MKSYHQTIFNMNGRRVIEFILLAAMFFFARLGQAQIEKFNPPYPRFGAFTFSGGTKASAEILKDFDVAAVLCSPEVGREYRKQNPDGLLLLVFGSAGVFSGISEKDKKYWQLYPEDWFAHDYLGNRLQEGEDYYMNFTKFCSRKNIGDGHGPETMIEHFTKVYGENIDFTVFDGVFFDWWWAGPSRSFAEVVDFNNNRVPDKNEMDVVQLWQESYINLHNLQYTVPGLKIVTVQLGEKWVWPYVNGFNYEDWPTFHRQWKDWKSYFADGFEQVETKKPKISFLDASHVVWRDYGYGTQPYKDNYRSVRFALGSCLLTSSFFYVDEGNDLGHHGNIHIYDEMESHGKFGYPLGPGVEIPGKPKASTPFASSIWVRFFDNGVSVVNATGVDQTITASDLAALDPKGGSKYYRFLGGQDPAFNNGKEVTNADPIKLWGTTVMRSWDDPDPIGDAILLFRAPTTLVTPIVIDNHENNQTSPGSKPIQYLGDWHFRNDGDWFYAFYTDRNYAVFQPYGYATADPGNGEKVATYTPAIGQPGYYRVEEWHGYHGSTPEEVREATDAPFVITYGAGKQATGTINQSINYGRWNVLGTYYFGKGASGKVEISNQADGVVLSDAIRFVFVRSNPGADTTPPNPPKGLQVAPPQ